MNDLTKNDVKKTPFPGVTVTGNAVVIAGDSVSIKENKECGHESDGLSLLSNPRQYRCKKCGELYQ